MQAVQKPMTTTMTSTITAPKMTTPNRNTPTTTAPAMPTTTPAMTTAPAATTTAPTMTTTPAPAATTTAQVVAQEPVGRKVNRKANGFKTSPEETKLVKIAAKMEQRQKEAAPLMNDKKCEMPL